MTQAAQAHATTAVHPGAARPAESAASTVAASPAAARAAAPARTLYLVNWDRLRVFAALDTLSHHLAGHHAIFGFGLPLFLMLSVALSVSKPAPAPTGRFIERRLDRVLYPWLFWALVFVALRATFTAMAGKEPFYWLEWPMLFYGPRIHLWFLPFIVAAGLVAHFVHRRTVHVPPLWLAAGAVLVGVASFPFAPHNVLGWPFDQWLFSVPAVAFGFAIGRLVSSETSLPRLRVKLTVGYLGFAALAGAVMLIDPQTTGYVIRFVGGVGLLVAASWLPNRKDGLTPKLTPLMLGVYVLHPGVYAILLKPRLLDLGVEDVLWLRAALGFFVTMGLVALLRLTPIRRFL